MEISSRAVQGMHILLSARDIFYSGTHVPDILRWKY